MTETIERGRYYPEMPPMLEDETFDQYTDRLTGADGTHRRPYNHRRNRGCSIGFHEDCTDPAGVTCECPCHNETLLDQVQRVLMRIEYRKDGYELICGQVAPTADLAWIQVRCHRPDTNTGEPGVGHGGKGYISAGGTDDTIVRTAYALLDAYERHECREAFHYKGERIFGPHIAVEALWDIADQVN
jgi:hypothetical protein